MLFEGRVEENSIDLHRISYLFDLIDDRINPLIIACRFIDTCIINNHTGEKERNFLKFVINESIIYFIREEIHKLTNRSRV